MNQRAAVCSCTSNEISAQAIFATFFPLRLLSHGLAIMRFLSDFFGSRAPTRETPRRERPKERERERSKETKEEEDPVARGKVPTMERTIYDVSPRNTLISNVSRLRTPPIVDSRAECISCGKRFLPSRMARMPKRKPRKSNSWCLATGYRRTQSRHLENKLERNRSRADIAAEQMARFAGILRTSELRDGDAFHVRSPAIRLSAYTRLPLLRIDLLVACVCLFVVQGCARVRVLVAKRRYIR